MNVWLSLKKWMCKGKCERIKMIGWMNVIDCK